MGRPLELKVNLRSTNRQIYLETLWERCKAGKGNKLEEKLTTHLN